MTAVIPDKLRYLDTLELGIGSHPPPNNGLAAACVMEAVAYVTGEPWSDHPACVSPVIGQFLRSWNDGLPDSDRQMLKPYIVKVVGTNTGKADDETRAWMLTDLARGERRYRRKVAGPKQWQAIIAAKQVTAGNSFVCSQLVASLEPAEIAYADDKLGEDGIERLYGVPPLERESWHTR